MVSNDVSNYQEQMRQCLLKQEIQNLFNPPLQVDTLFGGTISDQIHCYLVQITNKEERKSQDSSVVR